MSQNNTNIHANTMCANQIIAYLANRAISHVGHLTFVVWK
jgi:hypothetical protein